jgi:hypothetical protein
MSTGVKVEQLCVITFWAKEGPEPADTQYNALYCTWPLPRHTKSCMSQVAASTRKSQ